MQATTTMRDKPLFAINHCAKALTTAAGHRQLKPGNNPDWTFGVMRATITPCVCAASCGAIDGLSCD